MECLRLLGRGQIGQFKPKESDFGKLHGSLVRGARGKTVNHKDCWEVSSGTYTCCDRATWSCVSLSSLQTTRLNKVDAKAALLLE